MTTEPASPNEAATIVRREVDLDGRKIVLFELPRVAPESLAALQRALEQESPQAVAVELDAQRMDWLTDRESWEKLNLLDILRRKQGRLLASYLALRIIQKRFGSFDGAEPGDEMCAAIEFANRRGLPVHLVDRDMKVTGLRAWRHTPFWSRSKLALSMTSGAFRRTRPRPEAEEPEQRTVRLEFARSRSPVAARALLDERQLHMAQTIAATSEGHVALVLSPLHSEAVAAHLQQENLRRNGPDQELLRVPERTFISRAIPWLCSAALITLFVSAFAFGDAQQVQGALMAWLLINGSLTAIFTAAALAHPATVLAAALSAPLVSLNPAVGAGTVGALVQAFLRPPTIVDIEKVGDQIVHLRGWWQNRLARLVLIFVFANLGSTIGTFVALAFFPAIFA